MSKGSVYVAYKNGEKVCEGTAKDVAVMLQIDAQSVWAGAREGIRVKGYRFKKMPKGYVPEIAFHEGGLSDDGKKMLKNMQRRYNLERFGRWEI